MHILACARQIVPGHPGQSQARASFRRRSKPHRVSIVCVISGSSPGSAWLERSTSTQTKSLSLYSGMVVITKYTLCGEQCVMIYWVSTWFTRSALVLEEHTHTLSLSLFLPLIRLPNARRPRPRHLCGVSNHAAAIMPALTDSYLHNDHGPPYHGHLREDLVESFFRLQTSWSRCCGREMGKSSICRARQLLRRELQVRPITHQGAPASGEHKRDRGFRFPLLSQGSGAAVHVPKRHRVTFL